MSGYDPDARLRAVDFCSGGGHLGLLLAACFPSIDVVCLERNPRNCERIEERKVEGGFTNVEVMCADVADAMTLLRSFDIGVAIHACGWMTDFVHAVCLHRKASYVLCSCCVGKIAHPGPPEAIQEHVMHPRSCQFKSLFTKEEFLDMCKKADVDFYSSENTTTTAVSTSHDDVITSEIISQNVLEEEEKKPSDAPKHEDDEKSAKVEKDKIARRFCKTAVEVDRNAWSKEQGYGTFLLQMPSWATPKNDIIIGFPKSSQ